MAENFHYVCLIRSVPFPRQTYSDVLRVIPTLAASGPLPAAAGYTVIETILNGLAGRRSK